MTRQVIFTQSVLNRIGSRRSDYFSESETRDYQARLLIEIEDRLLSIGPNEGYRDHYHGPWANTRRIIVMGYRVYYAWESEQSVIVKGIMAPGMR